MVSGRAPRWLLSIVLASIGVAPGLSYSVVAPVLPTIADELARSPSDQYLVKLVVAIIGAATVVGAPVAGLISDAYGKRRILAAAWAIYAVLGCIPMLLHSLPSIIVARALFGLAGAAVATVGVATIAANDNPSARNQWFGAIVAITMCANLVITPISGFLGEFGWRTPFLLYLIGLPLALLSLIALPRENGLRPRQAKKNGSAGRMPWGVLGIALLCGVIMFVPTIYIPFRLRQVGISSPSSIALLMTVEALVAAGMASIYGHARRRISATFAFLISFTLVSAGLFLLASSDSREFLILSLALWGLGAGWLSPTLIAHASDRVPEEARGRAMGLLKSAIAVGPLAGVSLFEPVSARYGAGGVLAAAGSLSLALAIFVGIRACRGGLREDPRKAISQVHAAHSPETLSDVGKAASL